jgi:hypothetical protein
MVMIFEDSMDQYTDADFNDIIVSISDNIEEKDVENFVLPKYSITSGNGTLELVETGARF